MKIKEPKYKYSNVLLIDDSELDNFISEKILQANYFSKKVFINTSAKSAIEFLNNLIKLKKKSNEDFPEVIFIDINMPLMDGFQFIEHFKNSLERHIPRPKLVILTSSVYDEDRQKSTAISPDIIFLNKPLVSEMLADI